MEKEHLKNKLLILPTSPGCYIWRDKLGGVLYVGKAVNLKNRVNSYINNYERLDPKIKLMIDQVADVDIYTVDSEVEALILESNLIKKYRPKYNKLMKDDKNYSLVMIDWYRPYPSVKIVREKKDLKAEYFGPYPARFPVMKVLRRLRRVYPYCDHLPKQLTIDNLQLTNSRPCFDTHIGLCSGVCAGLVSKASHRKNITGIRRFFEGKKLDMIDDLKKEMQVYSNTKNFEKAAILRDRIGDLEYVTQRIKIDNDMDESKLEQMKLELSKRSLEELVNKVLPELQNIKPGFKIECFDISNIQGTNAVASMVVFKDGIPAKNLYRKFKIKTKSTPDDFAMMREVLTRRLEKLKLEEQGIEVKDESFSVSPDLVIVDGGKGQLSVVFQVFLKQGMVKKIPLVGLAKREEEIFYVKNTDDVVELYQKRNKLELVFGRIILPRRSDALYLIQRIRDEAHHFAITYHRKLRGKASTKSILDDVKGVGKIVSKKLLEAFGSIEGISQASETDLLTVVRNKRTVRNLMTSFKRDKQVN